MQDVYYAIDMMKERGNGIAKISPFFGVKEYEKGALSRLPNLKDGYDQLQNYYKTRLEVNDSQKTVFILIGFYNALVPLFFDAIGGCTYVLRMTSSQIRATNSPSTPPANLSVSLFFG